MISRCYSALFLIWLIVLRASGQHLITQRITSDDGLPSSEVYCIAQDNHGFIWIGTDNGLAKYDGKIFQIFTTNDGLPDNTVLNMYPDGLGRIWLATMSTNIVYIQNGHIHQYPYKIVPDSVWEFSKRSIPIIKGLDDDGRPWMNTIHHLTVFKEASLGKFIAPFALTTTKNGPHFNYIVKALVHKSVAGSVVYQLKASKEIQSHYSVVKEGEVLLLKGPFPNPLTSPKDLYSFYPTRSGNVIGFTLTGNYILFNATEVLETGRFEIGQVVKFYEDLNGNYWIVSKRGVAMFEGGSFQVEPQYFLLGSAITGMLHDNEGNFWFTDHNRGLHRAPNIVFKQYAFNQNTLQPRTTSLKLRNNSLWFSTIDGEIYRIDTQFNAKLFFKDHRQSFDFYPFEVLPNDDLLLPGGSLYRSGLTSTTSQESNYNTDKFMYLQGDKVWVGNTQGAYVYHIQNSNRGTRIIPDFENNDVNRRTNAIMPDGNRIWVGTVDGLFEKVDGNMMSCKHISPLLGARVMAIEMLSPDELLVGTKGQGVIIFNTRNNSCVQISQTKGLISSIVSCIFVFNGKIYVGTNKGLSILDIKHGYKITNHDIFNGLPSNEIGDIQYYNGRIWLATNRGVVYFDPNKLTANLHPPSIFITQIKANDVHIDGFDSSLTLRNEERRLIFSYNGVGYRAGHRLEYRYFLTNYDQDTTYTQNVTAHYTNLTPGQHTFMVWAKNEDGVWSETPAQIEIVIPIFFRESILFKSMVGLLVAGFVTLLVIIFYRRNQKKLNIELQTAELKQQALAALMNPHFVYNSLAAIQHFINTDNIEKSNLYLSRFARLVRQNLNAVRNGLILLEDEIDRLQLYLEIEKMRFGDKLTYHIDVDEDMDLTGIEIPSMILQPFVENAIWHGILPMEALGEIKVSIQVVDEDILEVVIQDNGPGLAKGTAGEGQAHHTSMSMDITKERLMLMGLKTGKKYDVDIVETDKGSGMMVRLRIPIIHES